MDILSIVTQIPINGYVVVGCLVIGYIMKKWMPTDNRIIPTVLPILGAIISAIIGGLNIEIIIGGALGGLIATGMHQVFKQYIEGKDLAETNGNGDLAEEANTEVVEDGDIDE